MNWLLIIVLALIAGNVIWGYKKGFMKVVLSDVPSETASSGTGTYGLFRDLAAPLGVAVFVPLFTNRVTASVANGLNEIAAAVNSVRVISIIEVICVAAGIFIVLLLPEIHKNNKGEKI